MNLIAHSMGNRALAAFLRSHADSALRGRISNIVLAAPDIDAEVFEMQIAPAISRNAGRLTLYASSDDKALKASKTVHAYRRAGQSGDSIVVTPGIETIDASGIDTDMLGHGYFSENKAVIDDLFMLIRHQLPAVSRNLQSRTSRTNLRYWAFLPS